MQRQLGSFAKVCWHSAAHSPAAAWRRFRNGSAPAAKPRQSRTSQGSHMEAHVFIWEGRPSDDVRFQCWKVSKLGQLGTIGASRASVASEAQVGQGGISGVQVGQVGHRWSKWGNSLNLTTIKWGRWDDADSFNWKGKWRELSQLPHFVPGVTGNR